MANIAIKGHKTRGKEVIEILEMLGGVNKFNLEGNTDHWYVLEEDRVIRHCELLLEGKGFTLEQFFEKFPHKVGDKVLINNEICTITRAIWDISRVLYKVNNNDYDIFVVEQLQPYEEETMESKPNILQQLKEYFDNTPREVIEKEWHEYDKYNEIEPTVNEYLEYINKSRQPKYPKTYEECCEMFNCTVESLSLETIKNFRHLIYCRNSYWKIAGEQMGLGKPWEPDWNDLSTNHEFIKINKGCFTYSSRVLVFPTEEMRDAFYENFKALINEVKELL